MNALDLDDIRSHLLQFTTDTAFIEQTIKRLSAPKRKVELIGTKGKGNPSVPPEVLYATQMEKASTNLAKAIEIAKHGHDPQTPKVLIWRSTTGGDMPNWAGSRPIVERVVPEPVDRDPCSYCGTRRDIGCAHSRGAA